MTLSSMTQAEWKSAQPHCYNWAHNGECHYAECCSIISNVAVLRKGQKNG